MSAAIMWLAMLLGGTLSDYEDGWTDGYCQAIADNGHGWRIDEVPHSEAGFTCVWSVPARGSHFESCSDAGGDSWVSGSRRYCRRFIRW